MHAALVAALSLSAPAIAEYTPMLPSDLKTLWYDSMSERMLKYHAETARYRMAQDADDLFIDLNFAYEFAEQDYLLPVQNGNDLYLATAPLKAKTLDLHMGHNGWGFYASKSEVGFGDIVYGSLMAGADYRVQWLLPTPWYISGGVMVESSPVIEEVPVEGGSFEVFTFGADGKGHRDGELTPFTHIGYNNWQFSTIFSQEQLSHGLAWKQPTRRGWHYDAGGRYLPGLGVSGELGVNYTFDTGWSQATSKYVGLSMNGKPSELGESTLSLRAGNTWLQSELVSYLGESELTMREGAIGWHVDLLLHHWQMLLLGDSLAPLIVGVRHNLPSRYGFANYDETTVVVEWSLRRYGI